MSAIIMDGKKVASEIEEGVKKLLEHHGIYARLLIVTDNFDQASQVYIRNKVRAAKRCGISASVIYADVWDTNDIIKEYEKFDAIIVQLPMVNKIKAENLIKAIPLAKDVDGFNRGVRGGRFFRPCTPLGIVRLLDYYEIPIEGAHAVIVGRSELVGRPLAQMLLNRNATVTVCHSKTQQLWTHTVQADILISAVGSPKLINGNDIGGGSVVIDVGINRVDGELCGDVDFETAKEVAGYITPVPGGVGPMTVAMLMQNTMRAAWMNNGVVDE